MTNVRTPITAVVTVGLTAAIASAHPGHAAYGLSDGVAHPLTGLDHVLAMLGVGLWAWQLGGRARLAVPAAFVGAMAVGGAAQFAGGDVPLVEPGILTSVLVIGLLIAVGFKLPTIAAAAVAGAFAVCHGAAHAAEMGGGTGDASFTLGFLLATAALHVTGIGLAAAMATMKDGAMVRWAGAAMGLVGVMMVAGAV
ncbi:MAG TPA: HupE/UreJ family protein [Tepidisphaeraceae bacterium]|nr:HupE/UreJ family protein [Tepidisphaeraceae bacterium]